MRVSETVRKSVAPIFGALLIAVAMSASANASSLRQGSTSQGANVTGSLPGQVLWTYYATFPPLLPITTAVPSQLDQRDGAVGFGDNILRLENPNGAANGNLAGAKPQSVCAMIYVFDAEQEMGECCGCPLSSTQLETFSIEHNLTSNWGLGGQSVSRGSIAVVATGKNTVACLGGGGGKACNGGCDPTNVPGYSVTTTSNLLGSITHNQFEGSFKFMAPDGVTIARDHLTEIGLFDDAGGDPTNLTYLQTQCGAIVGNGTGGGICNCPTE